MIEKNISQKTINQKILRYAKKALSVNYLGSVCNICGEDDQFKLTFHHRDPNTKDFTYSIYKSHRLTKLKKELDKCDLLCQNCHRELHYELDKTDKSLRNDKLIYLEYSGGSCLKCGYNKCPASLTFHHRDPHKKEFWIGGLSERINSISDLNDIIKKEIDKCDLLCANCHVLEHSDISFYENNKDIILDKINKYKERQPKIDRIKVYNMFESGMRQKEIAKHFNSSKSTISEILKPYKISKIKI